MAICHEKYKKDNSEDGNKSTKGRVKSHEELFPSLFLPKELSTCGLAESQNCYGLVTPTYLPFSPFLNRNIDSDHPQLAPSLYAGYMKKG